MKCEVQHQVPRAGDSQAQYGARNPSASPKSNQSQWSQLSAFVVLAHANFQLDFWKTGPVGKSSHVMVPPMHVDKLKEALEVLQFEYAVTIDNLQPLIDEETRVITSHEKATTLATFDYNVYHSLQEVCAWSTFTHNWTSQSDHFNNN